MDGATRRDIFERAREMGITPEFLWARFPGYAVLRRPDSGKWFALVMDVPAKKLGLPGEGREDIADLRLTPELRDLLVVEEGFLPGYHLSRENWTAVRLDGSVKRETLFALMDGSYALVGSPAAKKKTTK